jgi:hypothetical protein
MKRGGHNPRWATEPEKINKNKMFNGYNYKKIKNRSKLIENVPQ